VTAEAEAAKCGLILVTAKQALSYRFKPASCDTLHDQFLIHISVPLKRQNEQTYFIELAPIHFSAGPYTCQFFDHAFRLAIFGRDIFVLDNAHCEGEQFCDIFQDTNIDNLPVCLSPLFPGQTFSNVLCTPICTNNEDSTNPEVVQLSFDKLNVVTSPVHPLLTSCRSGHQQAFQHVDLGAVLVQHLDPHCKIMTAGGVLMFKDKNIVNVSADPLSFTTMRVIPYLWVKSEAPHFTSFLKGEISVQESRVMNVAEVLSTLHTCDFVASTFNLRLFILPRQFGLAPLNSHLCSSVSKVQDIISDS